jgi:predicted transcriptional regulator
MYPDGTHSQYATVQSLLDRLDQKGCVERRKEGRVNVYSATVKRTDLIARRLRETADSLCDGSLAPLLSHLVRSSDPTVEEVEALERLIERLEAGQRTGETDRE